LHVNCTEDQHGPRNNQGPGPGYLPWPGPSLSERVTRIELALSAWEVGGAVAPSPADSVTCGDLGGLSLSDRDYPRVLLPSGTQRARLDPRIKSRARPSMKQSESVRPFAQQGARRRAGRWPSESVWRRCCSGCCSRIDRWRVLDSADRPLFRPSGSTGEPAGRPAWRGAVDRWCQALAAVVAVTVAVTPHHPGR
jgi:hypothetical protein